MNDNVDCRAGTLEALDALEETAGISRRTPLETPCFPSWDS
jgi:hypothetical protein